MDCVGVWSISGPGANPTKRPLDSDRNTEQSTETSQCRADPRESGFFSEAVPPNSGASGVSSPYYETFTRFPQDVAENSSFSARHCGYRYVFALINVFSKNPPQALFQTTHQPFQTFI
jgi:hypothetical protein